MYVRKALQITIGFLLVMALAVLLMLFLLLSKVYQSMEGAVIGGDIISATFESSIFRNDYLQTGSVRAKQQWQAMHAQVGQMLSSAARKKWDLDDRILINQIQSDYEAVGKLFSAIVSGREETANPIPLSERENRLLTQLVMRTYDTVLHARKLQESSRAHLFSVIKWAGLSLICVVTLMVVAAIVRTYSTARLIADGVTRLRQGATAIGEGNLDYRIGLKGDNEFVELSSAFDSMTAKLSQSYADLETEVGERRRAEKALRESEARFRGTFENAAVGIALFDSDGRLVQANQKLCDILGYTREELAGRSFNSFTHPDDIDPDMGRYVRLVRGELESYEVEKRYIRKDGSSVWVRIARSVRLAEPDLPAYSISIVQDIAARKEAEEKLRQTTLLLSAVTENAADFIYLKDKQGRMLMANPATLKDLGKSPEEVIGKTDADFIGGDAGERIMANDRQVMAGGETLVFEEIPHPEGDQRVYLSTKSPYRDVHGNVIGLIGISRDITERKRAEEELDMLVQKRTVELSLALEKLRVETAERLQAVEELRRKEQLLIQQNRLAAMGEMLVNISHQWRQPLNVLGLILQELTRSYQRGSLTAELLDARTHRAQQVILHMSQTIDDFRNFLSPDKMKASFNVKEVVETTLFMFRDSLKEILVDVHLMAEEDLFIEGYRNEYAQTIMNILINARDVFHERKVPHPRLTIMILRQNGKSVVTFADNAGGIASDVMGKIFDPYFTTKAPDKGTGIGLFMSKMIIERNMNGSLSVRNTEEGAEFRIEV